MNKQEAQPTLDELVLGFEGEMSRIDFASMLASSTFKETRDRWKSQIEHMKKHAEAHKEKSKTTVYSRSMWRLFSCDDARTDPQAPAWISLNSHGEQDEELLLTLEENFSLQLNWFFVSAFEAYERFVKSTYAALGYLDKGFWLCSDYGEIPVREISQKPQNWFEEKMRRKPNQFSVDAILKRIREVLPHIVEHEKAHELRMWGSVAEKFRHIIVHDHGVIPQKKFWEQMDNATGCHLDGKTPGMIEMKYWISTHLKSEDMNYRIIMIDCSKIGKKGSRISTPLDQMLRRLANHALLIYSSLAEHFNFTPHWERK
ncbi:MAG: hypothetical protein LBN38_01915 [Verrucomicrobiota bacterium]|nr:hypothetical protein [Verrucomicrobiota bacterium]